ncbi:MAG: response regulator [Campylobacterales bacterium]|nr:response regulator [Campylobacterales bacterium]
MDTIKTAFDKNKKSTLERFGSGLRLMLVEDEATSRLELSKSLAFVFDEVISCENGQEALDAYRLNAPDIILTDLHMPILDGIALCEQIRAINEEQIIIAFSAYDDASHLIRLINTKVSGFISKPIRFEQFWETLRRHCQQVNDAKALRRYRDALEMRTRHLSEQLALLETQLTHQTPSPQDRYQLPKVAAAIAENKDKLLHEWCNYHIVVEALERYSIAPKFFANHFGSRVIDYITAAFDGRQELGQCPVMIVMLDFFHHKQLQLTDIYMICGSFKNITIAYLIEQLGFEKAHYLLLSSLFDRNFQAVIRQYRLIETSAHPSPKIPVLNPATPIDEEEPELNGASCALNYVLDHDIQELQELESDIEDLVALLLFRKEDKKEQLQKIGRKFFTYSNILISYPQFNELGSYVATLGDTFIQFHMDEDERVMENILVLIESFVNDLVAWRYEVFERAANDPSFLNQSFHSNVATIKSFIAPQESDGEIEFF